VRPDLEAFCRRQVKSIAPDVREVRPLIEDTKKLTGLGIALVNPMLNVLDTITDLT
jgi:hypothetical protein